MVTSVMYDIQLLFIMEAGAELSIWCSKDKWTKCHGNMSCSKPASQMSMSTGLHEQMSADQENFAWISFPSLLYCTVFVAGPNKGQEGTHLHYNLWGVAAKEILHIAGRMKDCFSGSGCGKLSSKEKICPKSHFMLQYPLSFYNKSGTHDISRSFKSCFESQQRWSFLGVERHQLSVRKWIYPG